MAGICMGMTVTAHTSISDASRSGLPLNLHQCRGFLAEFATREVFATETRSKNPVWLNMNIYSELPIT